MPGRVIACQFNPTFVCVRDAINKSPGVFPRIFSGEMEKGDSRNCRDLVKEQNGGCARRSDSDKGTVRWETRLVGRGGPSETDTRKKKPGRREGKRERERGRERVRVQRSGEENPTESAEHRMAEGMVGWIQLLGEQYCLAVIVCSSTCSGFPGLGPRAHRILCPVTLQYFVCSL